MKVNSLKFLILFFGISICKGSVKSMYDYMRNNVDSNKASETFRDIPMLLTGNFEPNEATTVKTSLWMIGQGGGTVRSNSKMKGSDVIKPENYNGDIIKAFYKRGKYSGSNIDPKFNFQNWKKLKTVGFGYNTFNSFKWSGSNFAEMSSKSLNSKNFNDNSQKDNIDTTMSSYQNVRNVSTTAKKVFRNNSQQKSILKILTSKKFRREATTIKSTTKEIDQTTKDSSSNTISSSMTTTMKTFLPLVEKPTFMDRAHHFFQRWMVWSNYKSDSWSFYKSMSI